MTTRPPTSKTLYSLSILFIAAPFAFGLIRAVSARGDLRMLWMALAAVGGSTLVRVLGRAHSSTPDGVRSIAITCFIVATSLAAVTGFLLGATAVAGVLPVAIVFGVSCAASYLFAARARGY